MREICCLTADSGASIARERFPFFGEWWIGPYERLRPEWSLVARIDGTVRGYLTGAPDTAAFLRDRRFGFDLPLLIRTWLGVYPTNGDVSRWRSRTWGFGKWPEACFPHDLKKTLAERFPAHLHMNVESGFRGHRVGVALLARYVEFLRDAQVPGVHLYCGPAPLRFYERAGFQVLNQIEYRPGVLVHCLGLPIAPHA